MLWEPLVKKHSDVSLSDTLKGVESHWELASFRVRENRKNEFGHAPMPEWIFQVRLWQFINKGELTKDDLPSGYLKSRYKSKIYQTAHKIGWNLNTLRRVKRKADVYIPV